MKVSEISTYKERFLESLVTRKIFCVLVSGYIIFSRSKKHFLYFKSSKKHLFSSSTLFLFPSDSKLQYLYFAALKKKKTHNFKYITDDILSLYF